jgi:hypothetical protein
MGGLGNQLFQIFTTIAYGIRNKRKIIFPYTETLEIGISRNTYWDTFLSSLKILTTFNTTHVYNNQQLSLLLNYREMGHHYSNIPDIPDKDFSLLGYFQSPLYFEEERKSIFSLIKLSQSKKSVIKEYPEYFSDNCILVSIHFRIGDYKNNEQNHPIMSYDYYDTALLQILISCNLIKPINILYFCEKEDNHIVLPMIDQLSKKYYGFTFIKVDDNIEDWKQMLLMSNCQHNIIANSSFSWWGAYFNDASDKIICYPSSWFGPALKFKITSDMFPDHWTMIESKN